VPLPSPFAGVRRGGSRPSADRPPSVLYIEDDLANLALVERILGARPDVQLVVAMQGRMGLDLARDHHPNLILLDVNLPDISGQEVLARLAEDERTAGIPVLVISADASSSQRRLMLDAGAAAYLTKPLDVRLLVELLEGALGSRLTPADEAV
jgi:CheY-like chemotaxis protein